MFKGQCSRCGWATKRKLENMGRACQKCGGSIYIHQEDRREAALYAVVCIAGMVALALLFTLLGVGKH